MKIALLIVALVLAVALLLTAGEAWRFSRSIGRMEAGLAATPPGPLRTDLPPAIAAFAHRNMLGAAPVGATCLAQAAEMRLRRGGVWQAMPARQVNAMARPGFAWVAAMRLGPLALVRAVDSYYAGKGRLEIRVLGAWRIGATGGADAALGEGLRYVAELPWFPDAILTNGEIRWQALEDGRVSATMDTAGGPARVVFGFDGAGDIVSMLAEDRPAEMADGTIARLDWRGSLSGYAELGGRRVPAQGEVGYAYPEGFEAYWRGRITAYGPGRCPPGDGR